MNKEKEHEWFDINHITEHKWFDFTNMTEHKWFDTSHITEHKWFDISHITEHKWLDIGDITKHKWFDNFDINHIKCKIFKACSNSVLCKEAVCAFLRGKHRELPSILLPTFFVLFFLLILGILYLLYNLYDSCQAENVEPKVIEDKVAAGPKVILVGDGNREDQDAQGDFKSKYIHLSKPVRVKKCQASRGFIRATSANASKTDPNTICRQRLANLLRISKGKKCANEKRLRGWFRDQQFQVPQVSFQAPRINQTKAPQKKTTKHSQLPGQLNSTKNPTEDKLTLQITTKENPTQERGMLEGPETSTAECHVVDGNQPDRTRQLFGWTFKKPCRICEKVKTVADCHQEQSVIINVTEY